MLIRHVPMRRRQQGFNLVELMIALVLGLIVSLAVIGFIAALLRSNSETILATRLTQELRSLNEVMAREVRRARYVEDPIGALASPATTDPFEFVITDSGRCITFGYQAVPGGAGVSAVDEYRAIRHHVVNGRGQVAMARGSTPRACADAVQSIVAPQFDISELEFASAASDRVDIKIVGKYAAGMYAQVDRTFRSSVFVRSASGP